MRVETGQFKIDHLRNWNVYKLSVPNWKLNNFKYDFKIIDVQSYTAYKFNRAKCNN